MRESAEQIEQRILEEFGACEGDPGRMMIAMAKFARRLRAELTHERTTWRPIRSAPDSGVTIEVMVCVAAGPIFALAHWVPDDADNGPHWLTEGDRVVRPEYWRPMMGDAS